MRSDFVAGFTSQCPMCSCDVCASVSFADPAPLNTKINAGINLLSHLFALKGRDSLL